jgi:YfiH family protein
MNILTQSALKTRNGLSYFEIPQMATLKWVHHAFLTRKGGMSPPPFDSLNMSENNGDRKDHVYLNRDRIATIFGFTGKRLILLKQEQKDGILLLKEPIETIPSLLEYDAMITDAPDIILGIQTADCVPIFLVDQKRKVIAAVHAGRQGTALQLTRKVLKKMKDAFGCSPEDLIIALGPSIGPCCYEIDGKAFLPEWEPFSTPKGGERWMMDIAGINIAQMKDEGIEEEQIILVNLCTSCHTDLFFSYRKEGQTGRQLSFIGFKDQKGSRI